MFLQTIKVTYQHSVESMQEALFLILVLNFRTYLVYVHVYIVEKLIFKASLLLLLLLLLSNN